MPWNLLAAIGVGVAVVVLNWRYERGTTAAMRREDREALKVW